nr:metallophosphoesterase family protein [Tahibacter harae]
MLVSDTHGRIDARIAALARDCDAVAHAGDVGAAAVLEALGAQVVAVRGNNDVTAKWAAGEHDRLAALPAEAGLELPGGRLVVVHGDRWPAAGRHAALRRAFPAARAVVYGHSHQLALDQDALPWILNPGAAGRARTNGGPSCLLLQASERSWQVQAVRHSDGFQA